MKLESLYEFFVQQGIRKDPRGKQAIEQMLKRRRDDYDRASQEEKEYFDRDSLVNPYADSRILSGTGEEEVRSLLVGIDMETPELLLAHALRSSGKRIDLVLAHHPEGRAYATLYEVMGMQADILNKFGVSITAAESMTDRRKKEVGRRLMPQNHARASDAARLLELPLMSAHTVADNQVSDYLQNLFNGKAPERLGDVLKTLEEIPEYREAKRQGTGPVLLAGSKEDRAGKIFVDMTGGTEGPKEALEKLADAGVGTIVGMHMSDDHYKNAEKNHLRVVIAGHISSDTLGMNLLLDAAEQELGSLEVAECSGFRRIRRGK